MNGVIYDREGSVWRNAVVPGTTKMQMVQVIKALPCLITSISSFDIQVQYAYESTHYIVVPHWFALRKEDELRVGRRPADAFGNVLPDVYVINGRRRYHLPVRSVSYYAKERD